MSHFSKRLTASLAGVIFASSSLMVVGAKATQVGGVDTDFLSNDYGLARETRGEVTKSLPKDEAKTAYGEFLAVKNAEKLSEGTLVKTGDRSSVSIDWMHNAKSIGLTRLWANTIATVSTKTKLVHLQRGELHHNKIEQKGSDHVIETKLLQARIHGTTVHMWVEQRGDQEIHRIVVSEMGGPKPVEVLNRINGSRVVLRPGIVLEIRGAIQPPPPQPVPVSSAASPSSNICLKPDKGELIFQDSKTQMFVYVADSKAILSHPAVIGGNGLNPIPSLDLIRRDMAKVPSKDDLLGNMVEAAFNLGKPDKLITKNFSIACAPTKSRYFIGPNVGSSIELPQGIPGEGPAGVIASCDTQLKFNSTADHPVPLSVVRNAVLPIIEQPSQATETIEAPLPDLITTHDIDQGKAN